MVLGMSLATFTLLHVAISLIAIVTGVIVMIGMLGAQRMPGLTAIFLLFTILTSATGFLFPVTELLPSHVIGIVSLVRSRAHAFSIAATCREATEPSAGRQRLHARNPAASAAAVVSKNAVLVRNGRREAQPGRQYTPVVRTP